jgi:uncharacterized protein YaaN involved in tellurite resistance
MKNKTKKELLEENKRLQDLIDKQKNYIKRLQQWIFDVCQYIADNNKLLDDIENYLEEE